MQLRGSVSVTRQGLKWKDWNSNPATKFPAYSLFRLQNMLESEPSIITTRDLIQQQMGVDAQSCGRGGGRNPEEPEGSRAPKNRAHRFSRLIGILVGSQRSESLLGLTEVFCKYAMAVQLGVLVGFLTVAVGSVSDSCLLVGPFPAY